MTLIRIHQAYFFKKFFDSNPIKLGSISDEILIERLNSIIYNSNYNFHNLYGKKFMLFLKLSDPHGALYLENLEQNKFTLVHLSSTNELNELCILNVEDLKRLLNSVKSFVSLI